MGARGPQPEPIPLKVLKGTATKKEIENAPDPKDAEEAGGFDPPDHLNAEACAEWRRVVEGYRGARIFSTVDRAALATYCTLWAAHVDAVRQLNTHGILKRAAGSKARSKASGEVVSPYFRIMRETAEQMRAYMREIGLTPASRAAFARAGESAPAKPEDAPTGKNTGVDTGDFGDLIGRA